MQVSGPKGDDVLYNTGEFPSVRLCGRIDPCASEEGVKGLRALGVRVPGPGRALARYGCLDGQTVDGRTDGKGRKASNALPIRNCCAICTNPAKWHGNIQVRREEEFEFEFDILSI